MNTEGSYECDCPPGYDGDGWTCDDIDECNVTNHNCSNYANCINDIGSYRCNCLSVISFPSLHCSFCEEPP